MQKIVSKEEQARLSVSLLKKTFDGAITVPINDGLIKCVLIEKSEGEDVTVEDGSLSLPTASNAIIEFENGKKMLITNSEWCSLNWLK